MAFNIIKKKKYQCRERGGSGLNDELNHLSRRDTESKRPQKKNKSPRALLLEPRQPRSASRCVITGSGGRGEVTLTHWGGAEAAHAKLVWGPTGESLRHGAPPHTDRCRSPQSADINQTRAFFCCWCCFPPPPSEGGEGEEVGEGGERRGWTRSAVASAAVVPDRCAESTNTFQATSQSRDWAPVGAS